MENVNNIFLHSKLNNWNQFCYKIKVDEAIFKNIEKVILLVINFPFYESTCQETFSTIINKIILTTV